MTEAERAEVRSVALKLRRNAPLTVRDKAVMMAAGRLVMRQVDELTEAERTAAAPKARRYHAGAL